MVKQMDVTLGKLAMNMVAIGGQLHLVLNILRRQPLLALNMAATTFLL